MSLPTFLRATPQLGSLPQRERLGLGRGTQEAPARSRDNGDNSGDLASSTESGDSSGRGGSRNSSSDDESSYTGAGDRFRRPFACARICARTGDSIGGAAPFSSRGGFGASAPAATDQTPTRAVAPRASRETSPGSSTARARASRSARYAMSSSGTEPPDKVRRSPEAAPESSPPPSARAAAVAAAAAAPADDFQNAAFQLSQPPCPPAGSGARARARSRVPSSPFHVLVRLRALVARGALFSRARARLRARRLAKAYAASAYRRSRPAPRPPFPAPERAFRVPARSRAARSLARSRSLARDACEKLRGFSILSGWRRANAPPCFRCASPLGAGLPTRITRSPRGSRPPAWAPAWWR